MSKVGNGAPNKNKTKQRHPNEKLVGADRICGSQEDTQNWREFGKCRRAAGSPSPGPAAAPPRVSLDAADATGAARRPLNAGAEEWFRRGVFTRKKTKRKILNATKNKIKKIQFIFKMWCKRRGRRISWQCSSTR